MSDISMQSNFPSHVSSESQYGFKTFMYDDSFYNYLCENDTDQLDLYNARSIIDNKYLKGFCNHERTIVIPRTVTSHALFPFWKNFFDNLKFNVVFTGCSPNKETSNPSYCVSADSIIDHIKWLFNDKAIEYIFIPAVVDNIQEKDSVRENEKILTIKRELKDHPEFHTLYMSTINFSWKEQTIVKTLYLDLTKLADINKIDVRQAYSRAVIMQALYMKECMDMSKEYLNHVTRET